MAGAPRPRRRRARRWPLPVLGAAATGLIAAGVLLPQPSAETAVSVQAASAAAPGQPATPAPAPTGGTVSGGGSVALFQAPVPPPMPQFEVPAPSVVPERLPAPFVPRGEAARTSPPPARCGGYADPRRIVPEVTPGVATASLRWQADGSADVQGYRIQAVLQRLVAGSQPAPPKVGVGQPTGCVPVTATIAGLTSGAYYVFWLEEAQRDPSSGVVRYVQVGSTDPVRIG